MQVKRIPTWWIGVAVLCSIAAAPAFAVPLCPCEFGCTIVTMTSTTYNGTNACECVLGTAGNDTINVFGGNDSVCAYAGDDVVSGGSGNDLLLGGSGNDTLNGDSGNDNLSGEEGNDKLFGGTGSDSLNGGDGDDCLDGGLNAGDHLVGGPGTDTCINLATWSQCEVGTGSC